MIKGTRSIGKPRMKYISQIMQDAFIFTYLQGTQRHDQ